MRALMAALLNDLAYQDKLREDFRKRRVHPSIESLAWAYVIGKPTEKIEVSADATMNEQLAAERELLRQLDLPTLETLAAESQALVDRAIAKAKTAQVKPAVATSPTAVIQNPELPSDVAKNPDTPPA